MSGPGTPGQCRTATAPCGGPLDPRPRFYTLQGFPARVHTSQASCSCAGATRLFLANKKGSWAFSKLFFSPADCRRGRGRATWWKENAWVHEWGPAAEMAHPFTMVCDQSSTIKCRALSLWDFTFLCYSSWLGTLQTNPRYANKLL